MAAMAPLASEWLMYMTNPWELPLIFWLGAVALKEILFQPLLFAVRWISERVEPLPSRKGPKPIKQRPLDWKDYTYLSCNAVIETVFISHLLRRMWFSPFVGRHPGELGLLNGPVALGLLIIFNDMFYAPAHRALHWPVLYRWIHKHHHRVLYPERADVDARNEHPLEQIIAMVLWWMAMLLVTSLVGMHAGMILAHLLVMVACASFNHISCDLKLKFLRINFEVRAHEMHHRRPDKNFGQLIMLFDHLMGTYIPYISHAD